ncbi:MAG: cysteine desulfurase [Dehalococcoidia bacterium]|nr:MAG: cysteine desulfurase [Dehalococcoidia bacterium]
MKKVYLDNVSTTRLTVEVRQAMLPYFDENFGNPSCVHEWGDIAKEGIESARNQVAQLIGGTAEEIIFTGSGTESNNFAIKGLALAHQKKGKHIIISAIEHFSVLHSAKTLGKWGFDVSLVPVDKYGLVDPEDVRRRIRKDTILVSIMHANSEVGTIEPIEHISQITKESEVILHTDAIATAGTIPVNVQKLGVDALSLASNQFYGPKGAGALWLRQGVRINPLIDGGVQEDGRRAGTENVPAIIGSGKAAELAYDSMTTRIEHLVNLRDRLLSEIPSTIDHVVITGHPKHRLPGNASFCIEFIEGEAMLMLLNSKGIAITSGSACTSRALKASHVLIAMSIPHAIAQGSLLFGFGIDNSSEDVDYVLEVLPPIVEKLRQMSPLYSKFLKRGK